MLIAIPRETFPGETRAACTPEVAAKYIKLGAEVLVEAGLGAGFGASDAAYEKAGAQVTANRPDLLGRGDFILGVRKLDPAELAHVRPGAILASYLAPLESIDVIRALMEHKISGISMEYIPRTTRAQKMDVLSSQANLGGYVAVILAAENLPKIFPMMTTAAGTIKPAQVFVVGAGVAGLQAIATAHRMGARVEAFDTRPVVKEQVMSLGAKFVEIDLGETGQTAGGYAKELTPEQIALQREGMKKVCASSDVVITTAQVFGRKAPVLITADMVEAMRPGTVVVDMAVETGGNVEGSVLNQIVDLNGVKIIGYGNLPGRVPVHASQVYAMNCFNLIEEFWDREAKVFNLNLEDDIIQGCLLVHQGEIRNEQVAKALGIGVTA